jgi:GH43 family beta-xylosidase
MKPQFRFLILSVLFALLLSVASASAQTATETPGVLRNPLNVNNGADPWLTYYDGNYYLAATTWASEWVMRKSPTLAGLKTAEPVVIYRETEASRCCNFWAPEFRLFDGHWYFYYTAGEPLGSYDNQRSYVLESAGTDPLGPYTFKGQLNDGSNSWSIDGSVMELDGSLYFLSSGFVGGLQSLMIAPMANPWTLSGARRLLAQPTFPWEREQGSVNEGPVTLQHDGKTFIVYSASACSGPNYKLGMLTYQGGDPLDAASWVKNPEPVFQRSDANGVYAPGHNGFFQSPDGTEDWIVYHATRSPDMGCDGQRTTRVQKIHWNADGTPDFGVPAATTEEIAAPSGDNGTDPVPEFPPLVIARFEAYGIQGTYLRHTGFQLSTSPAVTPPADSQFIVRPGLAAPEAMSLESVNFPGFYLRQRDNVLYLMPDDFSDTYAVDSTWWVRPGLADADWVSLESYAQPGSYIGRKFGIMALVEATTDSPKRVREDATFREIRLSGGE